MILFLWSWSTHCVYVSIIPTILIKIPKTKTYKMSFFVYQEENLIKLYLAYIIKTNIKPLLKPLLTILRAFLISKQKIRMQNN